MASLDTTQPLDYAVIATAGATAICALVAGAYTVPWRCCGWPCGRRRGGGGAGGGSAKLPGGGGPMRDFNVLWHGRAVLSVLSAAWALSLLLRVSSLWGSKSFLLPASACAWSSQGYLCRIYLTASLGLLHPLCAFTTLLMLTAALSRRHRPETLRRPNLRLMWQAALCTLPVAAVQAVIAWLGVVVQYQGQPVEASPRSLMGYFFATYWTGDEQQCSGNGPDAGGGGCSLCVFPAAAAVAHALFAAALLCALCVTGRRLAAAVLNQRLRRRMRAFQAAFSCLTLLGAVAVGVSVIWGPFSWYNQACWAVFVAASLLTVLLVEWEVVVWPVRDLRAVDKRLMQWSESFAAAMEEPLDTRSSGTSSLAGAGGTAGGTALIKAHNRSAEAEAYVQAAAAARTRTLSSGGAGGLLPTQQQQAGAGAAMQHAQQQQQQVAAVPALQLAPLVLPPPPPAQQQPLMALAPPRQHQRPSLTRLQSASPVAGAGGGRSWASRASPPGTAPSAAAAAAVQPAPIYTPASPSKSSARELLYP